MSRGNTRAYILARLERDGHTKLVAKVQTGEISARAAGIKVGYIKEPTPFEQAAKAVAKLSSTEWRKLMRDEDQRRRISAGRRRERNLR
jgi:hypothetical protein